MNGILFKPWKIKAIAEDDREWQTRRLGGLKEINQELAKWILYDFHSAHGVVTHTNKPNSKGQFIFWQAPIFDSPDGSYKYIKPRYQVGEVVYIKEAHYRYGEWRKNGLTKTGRQKWLFHPMPEMLTISTIKGIESLRYFDNPPNEVKPNSYRKEGWYKRSPLFMPEWAARRFIKFTGVGIGRVQEITSWDCEREGCPFKVDRSDPAHEIYDSEMAIEWFRNRWNSINAKWKRVWNRELKIYEYWQFPWAEADAVPIPKTKHPERYHCIPNPFVFVYSFKKAEK